MSRQAIWSDDSDGTGDRVWLDQLGIVTGLKYSSNYPGGCQSASFNLLVPENYVHRALGPGRRIRILNGGSVIWQGYLTMPAPGTPWGLTANGIGTMGGNFRAYAPTSNNALSMNEVVDAAISRGLPWSRSASIPPETGTNAPSASQTVEQSLNDVSDRNNLYWQVTPAAGVLTVAAPPSGPTHLLYATDTAAGRTLNTYVTSLYVHFMDITTSTQLVVRVTNSDAEAAFGTLEDDLDLSGDSPMSVAEATSLGTAYLAKVQPRAYFTGSFTATYGQVCTLGGVPIDLAAAYAGMKLRVHYVAPNPDGEIFPGTTADLLVGGVEYDSDADTLTITPVAPPTTSYILQKIADISAAEYRRFQARQAAEKAAAQRRAAAAKAAAARASSRARAAAAAARRKG